MIEAVPSDKIAFVVTKSQMMWRLGMFFLYVGTGLFVLRVVWTAWMVQNWNPIGSSQIETAYGYLGPVFFIPTAACFVLAATAIVIGFVGAPEDKT
jgi:surface polysaccharide O-acyltransferase-like enzyme